MSALIQKTAVGYSCNIRRQPILLVQKYSLIEAAERYARMKRLELQRRLKRIRKLHP